ncbi:MAG: NAD(P)/FAD-dependent oxidoreductase [Anaerolineae bacterium]|jgi:sarcosine oxidase subunit beta
MPDRGYDAVVVGGGLIGSAAAYHLALSGVRTLLLENGDLASGASGANFGLVQVQDAEFGLSLELTLKGYQAFSSLQAELDYDVGYRRAGSLLLIDNDQQWSTVEERVRRLRSAGVDTQLLDGEEVCRLEPSLSPESAIGAQYHPDEGELNPFKLIQAYALRGRQHGLEIRTHTEVTQVRVRAGRVTGVDTPAEHILAGWVVLAAGAWARYLGRTAGVDLPLHWVHGEALITEPLGPLARHSIGSAAFYEATEESDQQEVGFCLRQRPEGNVMVGEAAFVTDALGRGVTANALPAIARQAQRRFPALRQAAVIRGWAIPVAFVPDNRPLLGPVPEVEGLLVATGLKSTIVLTPLFGALIADMVLGREVDPRLAEFSPTRAVAGFAPLA